MGAIVGITIVGIGACIVLTLAVLFPDLRKEMFADLKDQGVISAIGGCIFGFIVFVMYCAIPGAIILGVIESIRAAPIRFSLRTLLIASTVVAIVLGLIVWVARAG